MSIVTVATHTRPGDYRAHLRDAAAIMTLADIEGRLAKARGLRSTRGAKKKFGTYTAFGFACVHYELTASRLPHSFATMLERLWFDYTQEDLDLIGLGDLRTPERLAAMQRPTRTSYAVPNHLNALDGLDGLDAVAALDDLGDLGEVAALDPNRGSIFAGTHAVIRTNVAEYTRMYTAYQDEFEPMDDTPIKMPQSTKDQKAKRVTRAQVTKAAKNPALTPKTRLKHEILNAIIAASIEHENNKRYPGKAVHEGLLADHAGHVAVDETHLVEGLGALPKNIAPGNYMSRIHAHTRQHPGRAPAQIGVTLGVAASRPDQTRAIPDLCMGVAIHHPTGGLGSAAITILDAIDTNNLRAPRPSNRNQNLIVDGGYTESDDLNRQLHQRGYGMVMKYAKNRNTFFEVGAINHANGDRTPGIYLFNGRPMCPGAGRAYLERLKFTAPKDKDHQLLPPEELDAHAGTERRLLAFTMPTNGRPVETVNRPRGGQPKTPTGKPPEPVMQVTVTCPAMGKNPTARCAIFDDYDDPNQAHLPLVPDDPGHLPFEKRPACCTNDTGAMRIKIPMPAFKTWQDLLAGSWVHEDWYSAPRAADERYNSLLKRRHGGTGLERGAIAPRKAAPHAMAVAVALAVTNRQVCETWDAHIAKTGGTVPEPPAHRNRRNRARILADYRANKKKVKRKAA